MFEYIVTGAIAVLLLLYYILSNKPGIVSRIFALGMRRDVIKRNHVYMERFREHKQSRMSRNIIIQSLPWLCVLAVVFILGNQYFVFAAVISGSMEPTFSKGDLVLMQTFYREPKLGDIVMFPMYGIKEPITHRVVDITEKGDIVTKGDANPSTDGLGFPPERVGGKAVLIGNIPIVLKGLGYSIRPENIGEFTVLDRLPKSFIAAQAFNQFRSVQPLIIFFATIFYFFILIETRIGEKRRFGNGRSKNGDRNRIKSH
jgi:signal peptidase